MDIKLYRSPCPRLENSEWYPQFLQLCLHPASPSIFGHGKKVNVIRREKEDEQF